ncbi:cadherin-like beta sandwich domain-containing protein [Clostridium sp. C2-6-12]|uniref:N-acetylmuramoyl-L-alanine amidase family protein n=1 Tax=Clostridium sp. C2-6-12 TaxID=2698832 RepID=UPI00137072E9|nr:cadherin-like beta sandwich domain-containing protein [Clostridium sp. C2-6-12]
MKKMGKRFMALSIVFASVMSFLPVQFGSNGQPAKAITTQIQVSGTPAQAGGSGIKVINGEYATDERYNDFTLSVDYKIKTKTVTDIPIGQNGVIEQEIMITKIDGIELEAMPNLDSVTDPDEANRLETEVLNRNNIKLDAIGVKLDKGTEVITDKSGNKRIGIKITGLPFGVNILEYRIRERMTVNEGQKDPTSTDPNAKISKFVDQSSEYYPSSSRSDTIVIQHANKFVQEKISPMTFNSYIGDKNNIDKDITSNVPPFLYSQKGIADPNCPLRYNFDVSDAVLTLQYIMQFNPNVVPINNKTEVYKNGTKADVTIDNGAISGFLTDLGTSDLIVVKLDNNGEYVSKSYAIQLKYNTINADKDYTLRNAGIKKLYYEADDSVQVYIGKKFKVDTSSGIPNYIGEIYIDKRAQMISMIPELGAQSNIAFKLTNHYDSGKIETGRIVNGQTNPYVDFNKGAANQLWLEVYEGKDGNIKEGTSALVIYKLDVKFIDGTNESAVNFVVGDNDGNGVEDGYAYLTQPGRTDISEKIQFSPSRRTYNLNFKDNTTNDVTINLAEPNTKYKDGTTRREYIKIWGGTSTQSDLLTELTDSTDKKPLVNVDIEKYKKIVVQAYYDQLYYKKNPDGTESDTVDDTKTKTYPLGEKYTFYIAKNPDKEDPTAEKSNDATLSNIKASNGTIKSTDGSSGFSKEKSNYTIKVPKIDTSSAITVTATNSNVKDITASIAETRDEYGLTSGEPFEFPLNAKGTTSIKIVVTAEDGVTTKTYNVSITNDTRGASALLKDVVTDNGNFTFDPQKDVNKIRVDQAINKLMVSPVPEQAGSRVTVNGTNYAGSPVKIDLRGSQKTDMTITVTSEDGSASKTYNFEIYRTDSPIDNNQDDNKEDIFYDEIDNTWVDLSKYEEWGSIDGKEVYFDKKGRQVKDRWITTKGVTYYLDSKGYKAKGWRKEVGGKTYYLDPNTGAIKTGWMNQNNKWYYLGLNGVMQKGWLQLNGHWYYFTPEGEMVTNQSMFIDDGVYRFATDGVMY